MGKRSVPSSGSPTLVQELNLSCQGYKLIAGIDEAGRGAIAGPVVAGAVILSQSAGSAEWLTSVRDSKELTPSQRHALFDIIVGKAVAVGVGVVGADTIDDIGIVAATRLAMCQAVEQLACVPDFLLIDCIGLSELPIKQRSIVKGDKLSFSIACASIVAKVTRDRIMADLDRRYPGYGLADHKGYGTERHLAILRELGPSPIHRRSFAPVKEFVISP